MRFNWNKVVEAVSFLSNDPSVKGPIVGDGYSVARRGKTKKGPQEFTVVVREGDYAEEHEEDQS